MRQAESEKRRLYGFRFLATVTAQCAGNQVDFTEEPEDRKADPDLFAAWLQAHSKKP